MTARSRSFAVAAGLVLLAAGVLTACTTPDGPGSSPSDSSPSASSPSATDGPVQDAEVSAAWLDDGRMIGIVTRGSSSCVPKVGDVAYADGVLQVEFDGVLHGGSPDAEVVACTDDLAARATIVAVPEGVDPADELEIRVTGEGFAGDTDLDGIEGLDPSGETDYLPSAGWTDDDGQFVILSWGSSSCAPMLGSAEVTSPNEVTVTFATPPADQVCTMDMAPRGAVAQVTDDSALDDTEVFAILTGGEFDNVRVPIIGND